MCETPGDPDRLFQTLNIANSLQWLALRKVDQQHRDLLLWLLLQDHRVERHADDHRGEELCGCGDRPTQCPVQADAEMVLGPERFVSVMGEPAFDAAR